MADVKLEDIANWTEGASHNKEYTESVHKKLGAYHPIVDHKEERENYLQMFNKAIGKTDKLKKQKADLSEVPKGKKRVKRK
jgi:heme oxygenase